MDTPGSQWRTPPPELAAEAARRPGGWVYEIDGELVDDPNGYVPPEAIRGGWKVDDTGRATGEYVPNDKHGPVQDDFSALTEPGHWLGWLGDDPGRTLRDSIELTLAQQVKGANVEWLKFVETPEFVTGGKPVPDDPDRLQLVRTGLAVQFALCVVQPAGRFKRAGQRDILTGVFSLAIVAMDEPQARERSWLDLGATMEQIGPLLETRVVELEQTT
ncbi:hypothetical protein [Kribbella sp. CA-293567]|uniref:hypothetical protein n=1 Tax=Kribbella sp. CA-293567 TaxID=3002436 RepID=UPI0022DD0F41|nr:hypothetical protein [Kribbella sp. CA-293567]WBQ02438.1 hypothetical protein OX958_20880 [Kribbella sp. CA-293567]